jgi:hypothetical protein
MQGKLVGVFQQLLKWGFCGKYAEGKGRYFCQSGLNQKVGLSVLLLHALSGQQNDVSKVYFPA